MIPELEPLPVLYRDEHIIAINKPSGMLVHRSPVDRREKRYVLQTLRNQIGQRIYPVHRLDKPTSGVLVFAMSPDSARALANAFIQGDVKKTYLAVVRGYTPEAGIIDYPLKLIPDKMSARGMHSADRPREAVTVYERLAIVELPYPVSRYSSVRYSLVRVRPQTGRQHQIRRHMSHIFHPIIGDTRYGDNKHNKFLGDHWGFRRLMLAATEMSLVHPFTGESLTIRAPLSEEMRFFIRDVGWQIPDSGK